jgi:hypothetical protein
MMYEDTLEKPKNPLRRAMRRRGQKQVTFTDPTYREAPQYDYSSEEEEEGENGESIMNGVHEDNAAQMGVDRAHDEDEITGVSAVNARSSTASQSQTPDSADDAETDTSARTSDEFVERSKLLV